MATCLLCPPDRQQLPDADLAIHLRREHGEPAEEWPDGRRIVALDDSVIWEDP